MEEGRLLAYKALSIMAPSFTMDKTQADLAAMPGDWPLQAARVRFAAGRSSFMAVVIATGGQPGGVGPRGLPIRHCCDGGVCHESCHSYRLAV